MSTIGRREILIVVVTTTAWMLPGCGGSGGAGSNGNLKARPAPPSVGNVAISHAIDFDQENRIHGDWFTAANAVFEAHDYFTEEPDPAWTKYKLWFDRSGTPSFRLDVQTCFETMERSFAASNTKIDLDPDATFPNQLPCTTLPAHCKTNPDRECLPTRAFVSRTQFQDTIFLCPRYWAELDPTVSRWPRWSVLVHEQSHRLCRTEDLFLTWFEAQELNGDPAKTAKSADHYQYFASDSPWPYCSAAPARRGGAAPAGLIGLLAALPLVLVVRGRSRMRCAVRRCGRWALASLTLAGCVRPPPPQVPRAELARLAAGIRCEFEPVAQTVQPGQAVAVRMRLINTGTASLEVLAMNSPIDLMGKDSYAIIGPDGNRLEYTGFLLNRMPGPGEYVQLGPGGEIAGTMDLRRGYRFEQMGEYRVKWEGPLLDVQPVGGPLPPRIKVNQPIDCPEVKIRIAP